MLSVPITRVGFLTTACDPGSGYLFRQPHTYNKKVELNKNQKQGQI